MSELKRRTFLPIPESEQWAYSLYEKAIQSFWLSSELTYMDDKRDFPELDKDTKRFIKYVLAFFASSDALVNDNLCMRFYNEFDSDTIKAFYAIQIAIEQVHSHTYSEQIDSIIETPREKEEVFNSIETMPVIKKMSTYIQSICKSNESISERLIMMLCCEGIMFSSSFCAIYWLKKSGKMNGLCSANELISRDEGLHSEFAAQLYNRGYVSRLDDITVHEIVSRCVELTCEFSCEALPVTLIGMNNESMSQYIKYIGDYWLGKIGHRPLYNISNPFNWMALIGMDNKSNFFEKRVTEYSKATKQEGDITLMDDF